MDEKEIDTAGITWVGEMTKINLNPGDTLVLMFQDRLPSFALDRIHDHMGRLFPGHKLVVLEDGARLGVLGQGE